MEPSIFKNVRGPEIINLRHTILGEQPEFVKGDIDKMVRGLQGRQNWQA